MEFVMINFGKQTKYMFQLLSFRKYICDNIFCTKYIVGLVQERRNSSAIAMELRLFCINPSI